MPTTQVGRRRVSAPARDTGGQSDAVSTLLDGDVTSAAETRTGTPGIYRRGSRCRPSSSCSSACSPRRACGSARRCPDAAASASAGLFGIPSGHMTSSKAECGCSHDSTAATPLRRGRRTAKWAL